MLKEGVDPNIRHRLGWTALMEAAMNRRHGSVLHTHTQRERVKLLKSTLCSSPLRPRLKWAYVKTVTQCTGVMQLSASLSFSNICHVCPSHSPRYSSFLRRAKCDFQTDRRSLPHSPISVSRQIKLASWPPEHTRQRGAEVKAGPNPI